MPVPENAETIYKFLTAAGFNDNAAAGWLGNIEQESGGNPHAGGNPPGSGLIQQLGFPSTDTLQQNMQAILTYVKQNGSIADINSHASSPSAAALYISDRYERPNAAYANNTNRQDSADAVAAAAKSGSWPKGSASNPNGTSTTQHSGFSVPGIFGDIEGPIKQILSMPDTFWNFLHIPAVIIDHTFGMFGHGQEWRIVFGVVAIILLLIAIKMYMPQGVTI